MKKIAFKKITQKVSKKLSDNPKMHLSIDLFFLGLTIANAVGYANEGKSGFVGILCFFAGLIGFSINANLEKIIKKEGAKNERTED
ncbi:MULTISPECIES: hypothetical protein [Bacillus]|uniref:hypothetical protein n=1 Tax=Bacillus TaxID=1386 RepID=UPI000C3416C6|nr:hypothetical protein [Bacillus sp. SN10]PKJ52674.1 hypothetical protein CWE34_26500 [Bacillus sp. SN10]